MEPSAVRAGTPAARRSGSSISVILVNYNGRRYLERLLPTLCAQTYPDFEILIVDNASADGSRDWLAANYPQARVIASETNVGFAAGNNLGIRAARGELVVTLNTDTEVEPDFLEQLAAPLSDPLVGSVAALLLEFTRRDRIDAAGIRIDALGFAWNRRAGEPAGRAAGESEVWGACAGAALYRRALLDRIGLFDEDYFAFYEDVDLAWRARRAGWECVLAPEARVYHVHGGSFKRGSPQKLYLLARNRWWTLLKNYPLPRLALFSPLILGADIASLCLSLVRGRTLAPLRGRLDAWARAGWVLRQRRRSLTLLAPETTGGNASRRA